MKKILVSDYDNTFYTTELQLRKNIESVKKFRNDGNIFVISTSRSWYSMKQEIDKYNIPFDFVCCNTGGVIFDNHANLLCAKFLSKDEIDEVENLLNSFGNKDLEIIRYGVFEDQKLDSSDILGYKIKGSYGDLKVIKTVLENQLNDIFHVILKANGNDAKIFLNQKMTTKEDGIEKLKEFLPKVDYHIITVGDDDVDLNMLKFYDGYRMEHSSSALINQIVKKVFSISELMCPNCKF